MAPSVISHYRLLDPLGEGGMGVVYRALDTRLGRSVALKVLRHDEAISVERRKRFVHEARAASALNHPHIITIYDIGQDRGIDFIAMEYVTGSSLAQTIARRRLSVEECLNLAIQITDALAAAHAAGICHRDLKPANIMVTDSGSAKVLDFGLAKLAEVVDFHSIDECMTTRAVVDVGQVQTEEGTILGTAAYMSPEQAEGKTADARSDVFSFGAVLYEMITGHRAFTGTTKAATLAAVLTKEPELPSRFAEGLPPDLDKIVGRCLRKSPERRWQSMSDLRVALEDLREEARLRPHREEASRARSATRRALLVSASAISLIAIVAVALWFFRPRTPTGVTPKQSLVRLTSDLGWTDYPAVSLDGTTLAYASDRSGDGNLDIWVQHIPNGAPVRLTRDPADDVDPSFSPDGSRIAFQSMRDGGTAGGGAGLLQMNAREDDG